MKQQTIKPPITIIKRNPSLFSLRLWTEISSWLGEKRMNRIIDDFSLTLMIIVQMDLAI
jgi:hypothetical protein